MIRPGLCSITFRDLPWPQIVDLAADAGLAGVEWGADVHLPPGERVRAVDIAEACAEAGLACPSYGSYLRAGDPEGPGADVEEVLATAEALGAANVRVWTRWLAVGDATADDRQIVADELRTWAAAAARRGLALSLEHHQWTLTETVASTLALLAEVGTDNLFTYWQPCDGLDVDGARAEVDELRPALSHLHVFHWDSFEQRHPLADGAGLWPDVLARVAAPRPGDSWRTERWAFLEYVRGDEAVQMAQDAATLRRWVHAVDRPGGV